MKDDTQDEARLPFTGSTVFGHLEEIAKFRINHWEIEEWAYKSIKLLCYDAADSQEAGYDSDDEEGMLNFAMDLSEKPATPSHSETHETEPLPTSSTPPAPELSCHYPEQANDGSTTECASCSSFPKFPHNFSPRKLQLVKPPPVFSPLQDVCRHFLAVSYCWPKDSGGNPIQKEGTYRVRDLNGTTRPNRAPDDLLDRAIDMAISLGLRFIWIDQECLPQDDSMDHILGVQAMDIVYNRAVITGAFLDATVLDQEQLDAVHKFRNFEVASSGNKKFTIGKNSASRSLISPAVLKRLLDFIRLIIGDPWYTRAWIIQEALSSGSSLVLVLRSGPNISAVQNWRLADSGALVSSDLKGVPSRFILVPVPRLHQDISVAKFLLKQGYFTVGNSLVRYPHGGRSPREPALELLAEARRLNPKMTQATLSGMYVFFQGKNVYRDRQTCDAATAWTLLRERRCWLPQDRIAILANMCNYQVRLDTSRVGDICPSLRMGLAAIALLNGDFSMFVPEVYELPYDYLTSRHDDLPVLAPFDTVSSISSSNFRDGRITIPSAYGDRALHLQSNGLYLRSYLWEVNRLVDLSPIKVRYSQVWEKLHCFKLYFSRLEGETEAEFEHRKFRTIKRFSERGGKPSPEHGLQCVRHVTASRVGNHPQMRHMLATIFIEILKFLYNHHESCLANAIWQSIRIEKLHVTAPDLPDEVGDSLFSNPILTIDPWRLLQLDKTSDDTYHQIWLINRIMKDGFLWSGRYVPVTDAQRPPDYQLRPNLAQRKEQLAAIENLQSLQARNKTTSILARSTLSNNTVQFADVMQYKGPVSRTDVSHGPGQWDVSDSHLMKSLHDASKKFQTPDWLPNESMQRILAGGTVHSIRARLGFINATAWGIRGFGFGQQLRGKDTNHPMGDLAQMLDRLLWFQEDEERRERQLVSVFDVDGPCMVATPFSFEFERLPHPVMRSMSVCWVVEPPQAKYCPRHSEENLGACQPTNGAEISRPAQDEGTSFMVYETTGTSASQLGCPQCQRKGKGKETLVPGDVDEPIYRVLHKVRGLWPIMEFPIQSYTFR